MDPSESDTTKGEKPSRVPLSRRARRLRAALVRSFLGALIIFFFRLPIIGLLRDEGVLGDKLTSMLLMLLDTTGFLLLLISASAGLVYLPRAFKQITQIGVWGIRLAMIGLFVVALLLAYGGLSDLVPTLPGLSGGIVIGVALAGATFILFGLLLGAVELIRYALRRGRSPGPRS